MAKMWTGEIATGESYMFRFTSEDGKQLVSVHKVKDSYSAGGTSQRTHSDIFSTDSRNLPLERQEAESFVDRYLSERE